MIKVYSNYFGGLTDITMFCKTVQWSGDKSQVARKIDVTLAYAIFGRNQPNTQISPGTMVWLVDDTEGEIFRGIVFVRSLNSNQELQFTAYDFLIYFLKSKATYNFRNTTAEAITAKVCQEVGVSVGNLEPTDVSISLLASNKTLYDIIMQAYTYASYSTGKQYFLLMDGTRLNCIKKGKNLINFTLDTNANLINAVYDDSIEQMINKVKIYNSKKEFTGQVVENKDWQNHYGILQDTYTINKSKNTLVEASILLKGMEQEVEATALGNVNVITGTAVKTNIFYVSVLQNATWYVDTDIHTWEIGTNKYTMKLNLKSENLMDMKEGKVDGE
ncbi:terminase [Desulfosporosinus sp. SB140]|uniref:XkdQ/YqbQ family protein n=1 Tax=Desulfosporosinus paludis TaxID=3115649 RepID=UPI00389113DC